MNNPNSCLLLAKDLITHLLCVDPAQRYTIDEFLAHPWCTASAAPPPPPTPLIYGNPLSGSSLRGLDSPLLSAAHGGRLHEGRSPGLATLKEAFDITYAVHRMEEEGARRRKYNGRGGAGPRGFLGGLNESDEDYCDEEGLAPGVADVGTVGLRDTGRTGQPRKQPGGGGAKRTARTGFELDLDGATLLERRHQRRGAGLVGAVTVRSPLSANSPLKMEGLRMEEDVAGTPGVHMA